MPVSSNHYAFWSFMIQLENRGNVGKSTVLFYYASVNIGNMFLLLLILSYLLLLGSEA